MSKTDGDFAADDTARSDLYCADADKLPGVTMPRMKGAELITEYLIANDIPYVFGICGHGNVGMLDPLYQARDRIQLISPRHEQVAAHMADAYFRVRHKPVATLTSCGPGSANIVMPLACALTDSSALLAITANVPTSQFNRSPFQEINRHFQADFVNVIRPVVKRSFQPTRVDMLPLALRQAMTTMLSGRPGPVNIDVPFNVFQEEDDVEMPPPAPPLNAQRSGASPDEIARALDMILAAQRPVIFIGHGVTLSEASRELTEFAKKLGIPVISSPNGMGCLDMTDPLSLGFIGRNGAFPANEAGRRADVVIAIGARFDDRSASSWMPGYSWNFPHTKLIHVDVDPAELGRNYPPDLGILADARTFLRQMLAALERAQDKGRRNQRMARGNREMARRMGKIRAAEFRDACLADAARARGRRLPGGAAGGRHHLLRRRGEPQLVHAVLERAQTAVDAQLLGLFRHGFRRRRRARRKACGARPAGGRGHRRRLLHHGAARAVHRGRIQHPGGLGDLE